MKKIGLLVLLIIVFTGIVYTDEYAVSLVDALENHKSMRDGTYLVDNTQFPVSQQPSIWDRIVNWFTSLFEPSKPQEITPKEEPYKETPTATVTATALNVRTSPGVKSDNKITTIKNGDVVTITGSNDDWTQVRLSDGTEGWVATKYLTENNPNLSDPVVAESPKETESPKQESSAEVAVNDKPEIPAIEESVVVSSDNSVETSWTEGYNRNISRQNKYNKEIEAASEKYDIDPLILKSLIAQESSFKADANNKFGYAGLTQCGPNEAKAAGLSLGNTKKVNGKWVFDKNGDERFNPEKSIKAGAYILSRKRKSVDRLIFKKYGEPATEEEKMKFYLAAYNGGEGTILKAVKIAKERGDIGDTLEWEDLIKPKDNPSKSALYAAIPSSWGKSAKYKEISHYVENIMDRAYQDQDKTKIESGNTPAEEATIKEQDKEISYTVTASWLNVRSGAGTSNKRITSIPKGTKVKFIEQKDGWYKVELPDGTKGWVSSRYLSPDNVEYASEANTGDSSNKDENVVSLNITRDHSQHKGYTCGPCSLQNVLNHYGIKYTEEELAKKCGSAKGIGTYVYKLAQAADSIPGVSGKYDNLAGKTTQQKKDYLKDYIDQDTPVIIRVNTKWAGHYITVTGYKTDADGNITGFQIADSSSKNITEVDATELIKWWDAKNGQYAVVVTKDEQTALLFINLPKVA